MEIETSLKPDFAPKPPLADVPCGTCTLCCKGELIWVVPDWGDDVSEYATEPHPMEPDLQVLKRKEDNSCIYLGDKGCTIHGRAPYMCRQFDCRILARRPKEEREAMIANGASKDVIKQGLKLVQWENRRKA